VTWRDRNGGRVANDDAADAAALVFVNRAPIAEEPLDRVAGAADHARRLERAGLEGARRNRVGVREPHRVFEMQASALGGSVDVEPAGPVLGRHERGPRRSARRCRGERLCASVLVLAASGRHGHDPVHGARAGAVKRPSRPDDAGRFP
jgi:hypothetical protein